jgi:phage head maturation protease
VKWWPWATRHDSAPQRTFSAAYKPIDDMFREMYAGAYAKAGRSEALTVPAVQKARNFICSISTLPLVMYGPGRVPTRSPFLEQIDLDVPNVVTLAQTLEDLFFESLSWWRITARDFGGFPYAATHVDFASVSLVPPTGATAPLPSGNDPRGAVIWVDGKPVPQKDMIRFDSPNPPFLKAGARAVRMCVLLDRMAELYANDPRPLDYFTPAPNAEPMDDDEIEPWLSKWNAARRRRATAYIPDSLEYHEVSTPTPQQMQIVELKRQAVIDVANASGIDPEEVGVSTTSRTYFNAVDRRQTKVNETLAPFIRAVTDRLSMGDCTRRGYQVKFDIDDYMKADPATRVGYYTAMVTMGAMTPDEVRAEEDLPAVVTAEVPQSDSPAQHTFDAGPGFRFDAGAFGDVPAPTADAEARTITGLAVPYNAVANQGGTRYRFLPGALQFADPASVKHFQDHTTPVGNLVEFTDGPDGPVVKLSVLGGPEGSPTKLARDQLLYDAQNGLYSGLSVGVDFDEERDVEVDKEGVLNIKRADLREVSSTSMPAFQGARVTKVAASRTPGGETVTDNKPDTANSAPADVGASPVQFTAEQIVSLLNGRVDLAEKPATVNQTRLTASVTDPAPYRFDRRGNLQAGSHDFSRDLFSASMGDLTAKDRAETFVREQFNVITTDVNELNPTRNRPDMYVDQRSFQYPLWEAINKGTLTDITPFTFPKFSSAASLVAAHTEGNEPSSGTFVTTSQTVTPTAVSGKAKISRETWDQGGNPQVSNLIWNQMVKGWYEALEAAAVTELDAASPTQIDFSATPGLADDDLDQALTQAFAALQFVRGGFSMDNMFTQIDLYKALVAATDADGRRLYPAIGPANAIGTVRPRFAALDINGVTALPAWALAATGAVAASSYLFDSSSVHGWASNPQRLTFDIEVANIYIGIWGYKATAISDSSGVREVIYDPA